MRRLAALLGALVFCAACSEPPQKELDRAQGAIDAARAAGAERYATPEFSAATGALKEAHDAVAQRDYRLALTKALDASERGQQAARQAADGKARARGDVERTITSVTTSLQQLQTLIKAEAARLPAPLLTSAKREATHTQTALQKARTLLDAEQYLDARDALTGVEERTDAQLKAVTEAGKSRPVRRRTG
jgi:hypothetical protein